MYRLLVTDRYSGKLIWSSGKATETLEGWAEVIRMVNDPDLIYFPVPV